jgi:hypothetical protein
MSLLLPVLSSSSLVAGVNCPFGAGAESKGHAVVRLGHLFIVLDLIYYKRRRPGLRDEGTTSPTKFL